MIVIMPADDADRTVSVELDFVEPIGAVRCRFDERGEFGFDPGRRRRRLTPLSGRDRCRDHSVLN
jgi:hypothetical protein